MNRTILFCLLVVVISIRLESRTNVQASGDRLAEQDPKRDAVHKLDPDSMPTERTQQARPLEKAPSLISLVATDGGKIVADLYGQGDSAVLLAHGGRFNKGSWSRQARELSFSF